MHVPCSTKTPGAIDPLPHQIEAVYNEMLPRLPLRFLLADDPGAGKTIMSGLYIRELIVRGDLERCLVLAPGSLVEQWQEELWTKFRVRFEIFSREMVEAARTGNPFLERRLLIARIDQIARNDDLKAKLGSGGVGPVIPPPVYGRTPIPTRSATKIAPP